MEYKRAFKNKTIEKHLEQKMEAWLKSFKVADDASDEIKKEHSVFVDELRNNIIVTGGSIASMLGGHLPNDYDIYIRDVEFAKKLITHYIKKLPKFENKKTDLPTIKTNDTGLEIFIQSAGVAGEEIDQNQYQYFEHMPENSSEGYLNQLATKDTNKYSVAFMTTNATSLTDGIQIITRFCGPPEKIHENFDFVHCTNYWTFDGGLVLNQPALESIITRELKYVGSLFPICSIFRIRKFIKRDWTITAGEIFKICWDISHLNLHDSNVLREQLTGVDSAYFSEVLSILQDTVWKDNKELDRTYLFELISRVFNNEEIYCNYISVGCSMVC